MADTIQSTTVPTVHGQVVLNPDGTPISSGGGGGDGAVSDGANSSIKATVKDYANSNPLMVGISNADGDLITSFGGGTQYAVDAAAGASDTGTLGLLVRDDALTTITPVDGDYTQGRTDQYGAQWVSLATKLNSTDDSVSAEVTNIIPGTTASSLGKAEDAAHASGDTGVMALGVRRDTAAASSGASGDYEPLSTDSVGALWSRDTSQIADDAAFTPATSRVTPIGFTFDDTSPDSVNEGDIGAGRMSANRNQYTTIRDAAGNERGVNVTANNALSVDAVTPTGIGHGVTTVTTAGTDVVLASSTTCKRIVIQSQTDNTGLIAVGATGVDATVATGTGIILYPGDSFELDIDNLADVFIDATVNGEGVRYTYFT